MKHRLATVLSGALVATALSMGPALAAPGDNGNGVGGCVDDFYGNATNERDSGNGVVPSQSPGPFVNTGVNEPPRNDRVRGASLGDAHNLAAELGFTTTDGIALCRATGSFVPPLP